MPVKKQPILTPRKSSRLASKRLVVMADDTTSHNTLEPTTNAPPSPPSQQTPSPPPSLIPTAPLDSVLSKLQDFQSQFFTFQDEIRVTLASITNQLTQMEARLGA